MVIGLDMSDPDGARCPYCGRELDDATQRNLREAVDDLNIALKVMPPDDDLLSAWRRSSVRWTRSFVRFHDANPHVFTELVKLAREWRRQHPGRRQSMWLLYCKLRSEMELTTTTTDDHYKLSASHQPYYTRLIMASEPDLAGAFETRPALADLLSHPGQLELFDDDDEESD